MKFTVYALAAFLTVKCGSYLADISRAYFDNYIEEKTLERIAEYKTKGKPAYCSFYE